MSDNFEVLLMKDAKDFIRGLDMKTQKKIAYVIQKARKVNNPKLFKKLNDEIWEFRISFKKNIFRLFAFWDPKEKALVICTHGLHKKTDKTPLKDIKRAKNLMKKYLKEKDEKE